MNAQTVEDELREAQIKIQRLLTSRDHWQRQVRALSIANEILRLERRLALRKLAPTRARRTDHSPK